MVGWGAGGVEPVDMLWQYPTKSTFVIRGKGTWRGVSTGAKGSLLTISVVDVGGTAWHWMGDEQSNAIYLCRLWGCKYW